LAERDAVRGGSERDLPQQCRRVRSIAMRYELPVVVLVHAQRIMTGAAPAMLMLIGEVGM